VRYFLQLVAYLFRSSKAMRYPRVLVGALIAAGVIAGVASTALIALITTSLGPARLPDADLYFVALCVLLPLSRFTSQYLLVRLAQQITFELRVSLSRRILSSPLRQLESLGASRLLATLTDDIGTITNALTNVPLLFLHFAVVASCLTYMCWLSWKLLLVVVAAVVIGIATYQLPLLAALRHFRISREGWDSMVKAFRGVTEGTKELKIHRHRREAFLMQQIEGTAAHLRRHNVAGNAIYSVVNSWGQVLFFVVIGLILYVLPRYAQFGPAVLTGYVLAILYMLTPLDVILNTLPDLARAAVALDKIESLGLETETPASVTLPPPAWRLLELRALTHTYYREDKDDNFVLGEINLTLQPGELVFLVGGNGSGKTTLAKLLTGLYLPEKGETWLDGEKLTLDNIEAYRQLFSVVFSDFYLFESLLGLESPQVDETARGYIDELHLSHKVRVENGVFSTLELSQGQRKRLALLTAYLEDRPIYLFDEWAADQDPHFKALFYLKLLPDLKARNKTVVVISHDDYYYSQADRIVKLDYGKIRFDGPVTEYLEHQASQAQMAPQVK
jgi:putative ATP-binding cassette transporter